MRKLKSDRFAKMAARVQTVAHNSQIKGRNTNLILPKDVNTWFPDKEGVYSIDVFPYLITRKTHPDEALADEPFDYGESPWCRRPYAIHRDVSGTRKNVICPMATFGLPCPICEERRKYENNYDENKVIIGVLKPQWHCLYNVRVNGEFFIMDASSGKFANKLMEALSEPSMDENELSPAEKANFSAFSGGCTLKVHFKEGQYEGRKFFEAKKFKFMVRKDEDDAIFDTLPKLDEVFRLLTYDQIKELFIGGTALDEEEDDFPEERKSRFKEEEKETPEAVEPEGEEPVVERKTRKPKDEKLEQAKAKVDEVFDDFDSEEAENVEEDDDDWDL